VKPLKKERNIKRNKLVISIFIFILPLFSVFSDGITISLEKAHELEKQGKSAQASLIYQEWLKQNTNHPELYQVLCHFSEIEENPLTVLSVLQKYRQFIKNQKQQHLIEKQIALMHEMLCDVEQAIYYYKLAFSDLKLWANDIILLNPAKLLISQGLYEQAKEWLYKISDFLKDDLPYAEALFLTAKLNILLQNQELALKILLHMKSKYQKTGIYAKCLLALIELYLEQGKKSEAQAIFFELQKYCTHAPEFVLADLILNETKNKKPIIDFYPLPYRYLKPIQVIDKSHATTSENNQKENTPNTSSSQNEYFICIGSFTIHENARILLENLSDKRLDAEIMKKTIKDKEYFRVVLAHKYTYTQALEIVNQLKKLGFKESFLIKD
jgi:tetratricopeptide (TPR) repeat protein